MDLTGINKYSAFAVLETYSAPFFSYTNPDGSIVTNNYVADENGFRSSLAPSNGPLLPLTGKVPKAPVAAAYVAAPAFAPHTVALKSKNSIDHL